MPEPPKQPEAIVAAIIQRRHGQLRGLVSIGQELEIEIANEILTALASNEHETDCACTERCEHDCPESRFIAAARRRVVSQLPEDEHDYTCAWIYREAVKIALAEAEPNSVAIAYAMTMAEHIANRLMDDVGRVAHTQKDGSDE